MKLAAFHEEPWRTSHEAYRRSALALAPAPEYASSEVVLSSLYRVIGLPELIEREVPQNGRDLDKEIQAFRDRKRTRAGAALEPDALLMLLHSALESPKLPNQSSKRFLQVTPLVPQAAIFSGAPRLNGSPWSAGNLVRRMVWLGSASPEEAQVAWEGLFDALSVSADDDIFARFLQTELAAWRSEPRWSRAAAEEIPALAPEDRLGLSYPARQFARDLAPIIAAKAVVTRRQWTSLVEAVLRIAVVAHVAWILDVQARTWSLVRAALDGAAPESVEATRKALFPRPFSYLSYGDRALPGIKDRASAYLRARVGLNAVLWALEDTHGRVPDTLGSASDVHALLCEVAASRGSLVELGLRDTIEEIQERENRTILCSKNIGSNIMEFARHVLGQRQTASSVLRGYDQGFALRKKSASASSPWIVGLGPVAVLALVHCSLAGSAGPRSVHRLAQHLSGYGIAVDYRDIAANDLGHQLRMLGLVLDSPDAESGMLLVPPFAGVSA
ncbi:hypothetical protein [Phenylobacterium sp.]|jgi:hypothetical protein|uniref:hypothetical protein n=1 Tax=Phenylobacterium sp. TaxID=1871053 RepID=UPI002F943EED